MTILSIKVKIKCISVYYAKNDIELYSGNAFRSRAGSGKKPLEIEVIFWYIHIYKPVVFNVKL